MGAVGNRHFSVGHLCEYILQRVRVESCTERNKKPAEQSLHKVCFFTAVCRPFSFFFSFLKYFTTITDLGLQGFHGLSSFFLAVI